MRIVDRKTFLTLPSGTVYQKYEPCIFSGLAIKRDSLENDWFLTSLDDASFQNEWDSGDHFDLCAVAESGENVPLDYDIEQRDGCFDDSDLFAVWTKDDVRGFISLLQATL